VALPAWAAPAEGVPAVPALAPPCPLPALLLPPIGVDPACPLGIPAAPSEPGSGSLEQATKNIARIQAPLTGETSIFMCGIQLRKPILIVTHPDFKKADHL
jgi:hypothetical protein